MLNAILDTKVKEIKLNENTILEEKDIRDEKIGILDIKATLNNEITCDIEMQMVGQNNLEERLMFYWSKMYISNIHKGENYDVLKKCIVILIGNFELKSLKNIAKGHTKWELREKDFSQMVLTEACEIHIIELPKLKKLVKGGQSQEELEIWSKFLLTPEELEVMEMENDEAIKKAKEEFDSLKQDGKEQYLAELRMKHILDTNNIRQTGFRQGLEEGKLEKAEEIAKEMLKNNIDMEMIIKCTSLSRKQIENLKEEL